MAEVMCAGVYAEDQVEDYFTDEEEDELENSLNVDDLDFDAVEAEFEASMANAPPLTLLTMGGRG